MHRKLRVAVATAALLASGCSERPWVRAVERSEVVPGTTTGTTDTPAPAGAAGGLSSRELVEALASDALAGRDNQTPGSTAAQDLLIEQISQFAEEPVLGDGYLQEFAFGSNILALIPGGDLADEYVVIGAHYDHVGSSCYSSDVADSICNGATDNATGVAAVVNIARSIAAEGTPRRSVLLALWDAEEDGLLGSAAYVAAPIVPLAQTVAYLNFDIQGAALLPSLADVTIAIGAETGGDAMAQATERAMATSTLQPLMLSRFLFEGRSDHANFAAAGVPAILFTDATGGCYHTAQDAADVVDFAKLDEQVAIGSALVRDLVATDAVLSRDTVAPAIVFADAVALLAFVEQAEPDLPLLGTRAASDITQFAAALRDIVGAGESEFGSLASVAVLTGVDNFIGALTESDCQSFVTP